MTATRPTLICRSPADLILISNLETSVSVKKVLTQFFVCRLNLNKSFQQCPWKPNSATEPTWVLNKSCRLVVSLNWFPTHGTLKIKNYNRRPMSGNSFSIVTKLAHIFTLPTLGFGSFKHTCMANSRYFLLFGLFLMWTHLRAT